MNTDTFAIRNNDNGTFTLVRSGQGVLTDSDRDFLMDVAKQAVGAQTVTAWESVETSTEQETISADHVNHLANGAHPEADQPETVAQEEQQQQESESEQPVQFEGYFAGDKFVAVVIPLRFETYLVTRFYGPCGYPLRKEGETTFDKEGAKSRAYGFAAGWADVPVKERKALNKAHFQFLNHASNEEIIGTLDAAGVRKNGEAIEEYLARRATELERKVQPQRK